jgi:hypothetical protein
MRSGQTAWAAATYPLQKHEPPISRASGDDEAVGFKQGRDALGRIGIVRDADEDNIKAGDDLGDPVDPVCDRWQFTAPRMPCSMRGNGSPNGL